MTFGELVKAKRKEKNYTQEQLANMIFSTKAAISQYESDKHLPKTDMIYSIAEKLDIPVEVLLFSASELIQDIEVSDSFITSEETINAFGYSPNNIAMTSAAMHQYQSIKIWNSDYTFEKFLTDIIYPYIKRNPNETLNLLRPYGKKQIMKEQNSMLTDEQTTTSTKDEVYQKNLISNDATNEIILSKTIRVDVSGKGCNTLVFDSSGRGQRRSIIEPNVLNSQNNLVIFGYDEFDDEDMMNELRERGYKIKMLDFTEGHRYARHNEERLEVVDYDVIRDLVDEAEDSCAAEHYVDKFCEKFANRGDDEIIVKFKCIIIDRIIEKVVKYRNENHTTNVDETVLYAIWNDIYGDDEFFKEINANADAARKIMDSIVRPRWIFHMFEHSDKNELDLHGMLCGEEKTALIMPLFLHNSWHLMNKIKEIKSEHEVIPITYIFNERVSFLDKELADKSFLDTVGAKSKDNFIFIANTIGQVEECFGGMCQEFISLCDNIVALQVGERDTIQFLLKVLGYEDGIFNKDYRVAIDACGIAMLRPEECMVFIKGERPKIDLRYGC